ncbi:MAG TPA: sigma-70 family RNA polymerase sigma factor [Thermomicrobiales bacterium]|nr:sigma-70 family RNA polymerase sigma factor [Thermomicrobiales bacterium]
MTDEDFLEDVMRNVKRGSARALQRLIDALWVDLFRYAARELGDPELAEDVVQDAFVYLWQRRAAWTPGGSPRAYIFRMVRNRVIDERRKRQVRARWAYSREGLRYASPATPDDEFTCSAITRAFNQAVSALPERRRETFSLVFLRGLSHEEAADVLGISKQTVSNQVAAALKAVRAALREVTDTSIGGDW